PARRRALRAVDAQRSRAATREGGARRRVEDRGVVLRRVAGSARAGPGRRGADERAGAARPRAASGWLMPFFRRGGEDDRDLREAAAAEQAESLEDLERGGLPL